MPDLVRLAQAARRILPPGCTVAARDPRQPAAPFPGEALSGALPPRLREFSAGRQAARAAMAELGLAAAAIPHGPDRAPVWPKGVEGTITHSARACLAAVRPASGGGIGLDLEEDAALPPDLWEAILSPSEREWALSRPDPGRAARLVFSAKEAAYKAQYPLTRQVFGFEVLALSVRCDRLSLRFVQRICSFAPGAAITGRWRRVEGHILTACWL
ncbi:4'-phosphopantetheinyl transferase family protein [Pseudogemmobacter sonorensis]|uniref:4'-phosphopantetheinyl transferase family protein n=1 Tax=Pseudogemmobacter sonorensis TaxID=2989681 RepID=UPI0036C49181